MNYVLLRLHQLIYFSDTAQVNCNGSSTCDTGLPTVSANSASLHTILQFAFGVIGGIALIFVVISALRFVIAGGESQDVARARETLIYALVGLVVCLSAELLVTFVLNNV